MNTELRDVVSNTAETVAYLSQKLLIVIREPDCCDSFLQWLRLNRQEHIHIMLLGVVEPQWLTDIPYSGAQALMMIEEHGSRAREMKRLLLSFAKELQSQFPNVKVSWQVSSEDAAANVFDAVNRDWKPTAVMLFPKPKKGLFPRFFTRAKEANISLEGFVKDCKYIMVSAL